VSITDQEIAELGMQNCALMLAVLVLRGDADGAVEHTDDFMREKLPDWDDRSPNEKTLEICRLALGVAVSRSENP
jgi:hypothetical protein